MWVSAVPSGGGRNIVGPLEEGVGCVRGEDHVPHWRGGGGGCHKNLAVFHPYNCFPPHLRASHTWVRTSLRPPTTWNTTTRDQQRSLPSKSIAVTYILWMAIIIGPFDRVMVGNCRRLSASDVWLMVTIVQTSYDNQGLIAASNRGYSFVVGEWSAINPCKSYD